MSTTIKPNVFMFTPDWPETYSYTHSLAILTNLPIIMQSSLNNFCPSVFEQTQPYKHMLIAFKDIEIAFPPAWRNKPTSFNRDNLSSCLFHLSGRIWCAYSFFNRVVLKLQNFTLFVPNTSVYTQRGSGRTCYLLATCYRHTYWPAPQRSQNRNRSPASAEQHFSATSLAVRPKINRQQSNPKTIVGCYDANGLSSSCLPAYIVI